MATTTSTHTPYHDFTLDELEAYDRGILEPERTAVIVAHLAQGCPACRRWLAGSDEAVRLIEALACDGLGRLRPKTRWDRARAWGRRRIRARRLTVLLYAVPLKAALVAVVVRAGPRRGARLSAAVGLIGLTAGVVRHGLAARARPARPRPWAGRRRRARPTTRACTAGDSQSSRQDVAWGEEERGHGHG